MNGPIIVNGFFGDAVLRTAQDISTISKDLIKGLEIENVRFRSSGKFYPSVLAPIKLGSNLASIKHRLFILQDQNVLDYVNRAPPMVCSSFGVVLGTDFFRDTKSALRGSQSKSTLTEGSPKELLGGDESNCVLKSSLFGMMPHGSLRPFRPYDFCRTYEYEPDHRVILLFDMDCFEVQVHEESYQQGKPRVVVNSSDRIVAVSYEAKKLGINRDSTPYLAQAQAKCSDLIPIYIPIRKGLFTGGPKRPDGRPAREASARIVNAIKSVLAGLGQNLTTFQFSSADEFYVEVTKLVSRIQSREKRNELFRENQLWPNTFLYNDTTDGTPLPEDVLKRIQYLMKKPALSGLEDQEIRLLLGSTVGNTIVRQILEITGYQSSVGVGSNVTMTKIASSTHKPGSITIFAPSGFENISHLISVEDIPGLGGKIGLQIKREFSVHTMENLGRISFQALENFRTEDGRILGEEKAKEIKDACRGICKKQIVSTNCYKTSGVGRKLYGKRYNDAMIHLLLQDQCEEMMEKLEFELRVNRRNPSTIKMVIYTTPNLENIHSIIELGNGQIQNKEEMYDLFLDKCQPWIPESSEYEEIKITATF